MDHVYKQCQKKICAECRGKGEVVDAPGNALAGRSYMTECEECHGTGTSHCGGCKYEGHDCMFESLAICEVCGCYEGSLLPFCPGRQVSFDEQTSYYHHYCNGTGPFARATETTVDIAWKECWKYLCGRGSPGSVYLYNQVTLLYSHLRFNRTCAICSESKLFTEGGVVEPASKWICNVCLMNRITP